MKTRSQTKKKEVVQQEVEVKKKDKKKRSRKTKGKTKSIKSTQIKEEPKIIQTQMKEEPKSRQSPKTQIKKEKESPKTKINEKPVEDEVKNLPTLTKKRKNNDMECYKITDENICNRNNRCSWGVDSYWGLNLFGKPKCKSKLFKTLGVSYPINGVEDQKKIGTHLVKLRTKRERNEELSEDEKSDLKSLESLEESANNLSLDLEVDTLHVLSLYKEISDPKNRYNTELIASKKKEIADVTKSGLTKFFEFSNSSASLLIVTFTTCVLVLFFSILNNDKKIINLFEKMSETTQNVAETHRYVAKTEVGKNAANQFIKYSPELLPFLYVTIKETSGYLFSKVASSGSASLDVISSLYSMSMGEGVYPDPGKIDFT